MKNTNYKIGKLLFVRNYYDIYKPLYSDAGFNVDNHYIYMCPRGLVYPLTHRPVVYNGVVETIKISDVDIIGRPDPQYIVPLAHEFNNDVYNINRSPKMDNYFKLHRTKIEEIADECLSNGHQLKDFTEYEKDNKESSDLNIGEIIRRIKNK